MSRYFPLFIDLEKKKITVIGAGVIAERRIRTLLDFGPRITVLAPRASENIRDWDREGRLCWIEDSYRPGMKGLLEDCVFVLAATDDPQVNQKAAEECRSRGIPVNLANDRTKCDFYFPGIAAGGGVVAGVTAEGTNHRLAKEAAEKIRQLLKAAEKER